MSREPRRDKKKSVKINVKTNGFEGYYLGLSPLILSIAACVFDVNIHIDSPLFRSF